MNRPHFRRHPRPDDRLHDLLPCPICDLEPLGPTRYDAEWPSVVAAEPDPARMAAEDAALAALAAEAPGGDLAAMAAPWPGRSCPGCGYTPPDADTCVVGACVPGYHEVALIPVPGMFVDALGTYAEPEAAMYPMHEGVPYVQANPPRARGRHRQTDPAGLGLADLRDLDGLS